MIKVFIGYGGPKAESIANKLDSFLKNEELDTFLASPESRSLASISNFKFETEKNMRDCNIIVFVCHDGTKGASPAIDEIDFIIKNKLQNKLIVYSKCDHCIPHKLSKNRWHPMHFAPEKAEESFCRLLNEILRCHITLSYNYEIEPEEIGG
jgi:hypothetical protein